MASKQELESILKRISELRITVVGDCSVDIYWDADMQMSRLSREVPHYPLPVYQERFSLGAAGNVAANLEALGVQDVRMVSIVGCDWRGEIMRRLFREQHLINAFLAQSESVVTPA